VASGVTGAASEVANTVSPAVVAQVVAEAPKALAAITDQAKEAFFKKEIPFGSIIYSEAMKNDLPPELVAAVVHTESRFVPTARSQAGAIGLMQLVPRTGRWLGARNLSDRRVQRRRGERPPLRRRAAIPRDAQLRAESPDLST
jgi:soluble lytic murein transglycosylase-like protein